MTCKFVDECHTQVGNYTYHICEFAEMMERAGTTYLPEKPPELPDRCFAILPSSGEIIVIEKGQKGYQRSGLSESPKKNRRFVTQHNRYSQITRQQEAAMLGGSMFGWNTPAARTSSYDLRGNPIAPARGKSAKSKAPER